MANWWDTPEIEAAKKKALAGGSAGVFSLAQLKALGQTGDSATDWMAGAKKDPLLAGGGRAVVDPKLNLPAGYYQIPGASGAYHYDPRSGQVSQEFADWANSGKIERNDLTGLPKALMDQRDGGDVFRAGADQDPNTLRTLDDIFKIGKGADGTYQDAQDRVLGLGRYQQFLADKDGKQMRVSDVAGSPLVDPATAPYADASAPKGGFDRLMKLTGGTRADVNKMIGGGVDTTVPFGEKTRVILRNEFTIAPTQYQEGTADTQSSLEDSLAANYTKRATMWKSLQEQRAARGLDVSTGTSDAEKKRIYDTVSRIGDPTQRSAYLKAQDRGNLTSGLRDEQYALRAGERDQIANYEKSRPEIRYDYNETNKYGDTKGKGIQVKITSGSQVVTDPATGREVFVGSVPKSLELVKSRVKDIDRAAAATQGAAVGFMTGGIPGAFLGAASGMGLGPNVKNISFKDMKGLGQWDMRDPHMMSFREVGSAFAFAAITGTGGYGQATKGVAVGMAPKITRIALMATPLLLPKRK